MGQTHVIKNLDINIDIAHFSINIFSVLIYILFIFSFLSKFWKKLKPNIFLPKIYDKRSQITTQDKAIKNKNNNSDILFIIELANNIKNIAQSGIHNWLKNVTTKRNKYKFDSKNVVKILISIFIFFKCYYKFGTIKFIFFTIIV